MLRLAAKYADSWHGSSKRDPAEFLTACVDVGRDPKTIELTRSITVFYPDLGRVPPSASESEIGNDALVAQLRTCEELGIGHVQCQFFPPTPAALSQLADGLAAYRRG